MSTSTTRPPSREETVELFRRRLTQLIDDSDLSQSAFATKVGIDRSTLSQLLSPKNDRLPRADSLVSIGRAEKVSIDWLLGLTQEGPLSADIVQRDPVEFARDARSPVDARLAQWLEEAAGYKIRYVPATLPDMLKTERIIEHEYQESAAFTPAQSLDWTQSRLSYLRRPETDMEVCCAKQALEELARGEGLWRDLDADARRAQLRRMIDVTEELYPTFRWHLFDARQHYSAPLNIFGTQRALLYVGPMYLVFNSLEHIRVLTAHFDGLVRAAVVQPTELVPLLRELLDAIRG